MSKVLADLFRRPCCIQHQLYQPIFVQLVLIVNIDDDSTEGTNARIGVDSKKNMR